MLLYFSDVFGRLSALSRDKEFCALPVDALKAEMILLLEQSMQKAIDSGDDPRRFDSARFAVAAWVDEFIMNQEGVNPISWSTEPLQKRFYDTTQGGELFFTRMDQVRNDADVLEVFYTCLKFGYKGKYGKDENSTELDAIILDVYQNLMLERGDLKGLSSRARRQIGSLVSDEQSRARNWISYAIITSAALLCFGYWLMLSSLETLASQYLG